MKNYIKYISLLSLSAFISASCEDGWDIPDPEKPSCEITMTKDGAAFGESDILSVYRGETSTINYTTEGVSKVVAKTPDGWNCKVSSANGTIDVTAPDYADKNVSSDAEISLQLYDGTGGDPLQAVIHARAVSRDIEFSIKDVTDSLTFTLGQRIVVSYDASVSVETLEFSLPQGWTGEMMNDGTFVIYAPDLTKVDGAEDGTVVVTPVSYDGTRGESISIPVAVKFQSTLLINEKEVNFNKGETKQVSVTVSGIRHIDELSPASGWTIDASTAESGYITVTAPSGDGSYEGLSPVKFTGTDARNQPISSEECVLRLYGINSLDEMKAMRDEYGALTEHKVDNKPVISDKYLVDGAITLNTDITIGYNDLEPKWHCYFVNTLVYDLDGGGHTITYDNISITKNFYFGFCKFARGVTVKNINLAGSVSFNNQYVGNPVAGFASMSYGSTFQNIHNSVNFHVKNTMTKSSTTTVGGLIGVIKTASDVSDYVFDGSMTLDALTQYAGGVAGDIEGGACTFSDCKVSGTFTINKPILFFGGIAGKTTMGKPGAHQILTDCEFSGKLTYTQTAANNLNTRLGGVIGGNERYGTYTRCGFTGEMTFNLGRTSFLQDIRKGAGGILGRITAPVNGYSIKCEMTDCYSTGSITVNNAVASDKGSFGTVIGCIPDNAGPALTQTGTTDTATLTFND